jgi:hypothetical protein
MSLHAGARSWRALPRNERLRCVVLECGAGRLREADGFDETIAVAQMHGESPLAFAQRVIERIASIDRSGRSFESATLLVGPRDDWPAKAARRLIALALSAHARARRDMSELTLAAVGEAKPEGRAELLGLAEELMALPNSSSVPVRVRFGSGATETRRTSGILRAVSPPRSCNWREAGEPDLRGATNDVPGST